jgi:hypothetical protein
MIKAKIKHLSRRYFSIQRLFLFIEVVVLVLKPFYDFTQIIATEKIFVFLRTLKIVMKGFFHQRKRYFAIRLYDQTVDVVLIGRLDNCLALFTSYLP